MLKTKVLFFITITFVLSSEPIHSINPWQSIAAQGEIFQFIAMVILVYI